MASAGWVMGVVRAPDPGIRANDQVLLHGALSDIRLFHILELLIIASDEIKDAEQVAFAKPTPHEKRNPMQHYIVPAIVAYTLRSFCRAGDFRIDKDQVGLAAALQGKAAQKFAVRIATAFLKRWSTSTPPDLSNWKSMDPGGDYKLLTLRSWPKVRHAHRVSPVSSHNRNVGRSISLEIRSFVIPTPREPCISSEAWA